MPEHHGDSDEPELAGFDHEPELSAAERELRGVPTETPSGDPIRNVYYVAFVAALGGLLYGYDTGVISGTLMQITQDLSLIHISEPTRPY